MWISQDIFRLPAGCFRLSLRIAGAHFLLAKISEAELLTDPGQVGRPRNATWSTVRSSLGRCEQATASVELSDGSTQTLERAFLVDAHEAEGGLRIGRPPR